MTQLERVVLEARLSKRTKQIYLAAVRSFIDYAGVERKRWDDAMVTRWRKYRGFGLKPKTLNLELTAIRYAFDKVGIKLNVQPLPEKKKAVAKSLTGKEINRLFATCHNGTPADERDRSIIDLMLHDKMRRDQIAKLRIGSRDALALPFLKLLAWTSWLQDQGIRTGYIFRSLGRPNVEGVQKIGKRLTPDAIYKIIRARGKKAGLEISPDMLRRGSR